MKRIFDLNHTDFMTYTKQDIIESITKTEGRTVMSETVISIMPLLDGISNPETASAFGADMITLNTFSFESPFIFGYDDDHFNMFGGLEGNIDQIKNKIKENKQNPNYIKDFKTIVGRFIGVNLEPVPEHIPYNEGARLNEKNLIKFKEQGFDYVVITANPNTGINSDDITRGIKETRRVLGDDVLIIAGKMHGAGAGNIYDSETIEEFITSGADVILVPAPGTVPGFTTEQTKKFVDLIHDHKGLAMTTIGTSQEGSSNSLIETIALQSKMAGADIQHIGDAGFSGIAHPENITTLSVAIRGKRHTYRQMARSKRR